MDMPDNTTRAPLAGAFETLRGELSECIIGQKLLVERLLIALLADGHLLVEGAPGLAKTTAIKELSARIEGDFHRVQFTPDLLPADLTGTEIYRPQQGTFEFQRGPIFHNLLLADEINRAPAKVQSALLEAMGERQVTVGRTTYLPGDGDTESNRTGRHLSVARSAARPFSDAHPHRLSRCIRGSRNSQARTRARQKSIA
jgi:MoxR-like ATPase